MNKVIYNILFIIFFIFSNNVFAEEVEYNTEANIQKAILVEDYITKHKNNIEEFIIKYQISSTINLGKDIDVLNESIDALRAIQNTSIEKQKAEDIMQAVIVRIKTVNDSLKVKLAIKKEEFELNLQAKKNVYSKLGIKLSNKIDSINLKIAKTIFKNKIVLTEKESRLKQNLIQLNKESLKLRNFGNIDFKSEKEIKESFIRILKNIKREVSSMKTVLK